VRIWIRRLLLALVALAVGAAIVYAFLPKPVPVDLAPVTRGGLRVTVDDDGKTRVRLPERYEISAPLAGKMRRIELEAGDPVVAGETVLAAIEPPDPALLDPRAYATAEASVKEMEKGVEHAAAAVREAEKAHDFAYAELARVRASGRGSTPQELEDASLKEHTTAERLRGARAAARMADFRLEQARAALIWTKPRSPGEEQARMLEIRSPVDGQVLRVLQRDEAVVAPGQKLIEVGDAGDTECVIDLISSDAVKVAPGAAATLEHWGGDYPLNGRVRRVEPSGFLKISALGVEEQRVNVIIDFTDPPEKRRTLGDAYRVEARIVVWEAADVLKVPASALFKPRDRWMLYVVKDGRAVLREVEVGPSNALERQIVAGVEEGEQVVSHPGDKLKDGVAVVPRAP
jgi:HlyD family secretion protein